MYTKTFITGYNNDNLETTRPIYYFAKFGQQGNYKELFKAS